MSIKTIDQSIRSNTEGVKKRINKGAEKMVFDILQATQYSTPIPSTVRELATNACDSQREKEIAIEILSGKKTEEDYYIRRDGEQYADSNFDPEYYDLKHLDTDNHDVIIKYHQNPGIGYCDKLEITDYGVGIGGRRLEGVLELGFSTKRNTAENFGAFGLGAKVALSTGVDFYTIETVHNGKKFKCNCYPYKTDFMVPKFHPYIEFTDGTKVHYEETTEKNYTKISFGVKKHNRQRFTDSIAEQLVYLSNVKYFIIDEDGDENERNIHSTVLHNSPSILVSSSYMYTRPHIIIVKEPGADTGINYGYIDFRELEMEQLWGAVGLKCPIRQVIKDPMTGEETIIQEGVEVTPSREKVIWNEHTKKFVQGVIEKAAEEATTLVEDSLKDTDFFKWIKSCRDVLSKASYGDGGSALKQISQIIDTDKMKPKFDPLPTVKFAGPKGLLPGFTIKNVTETVKDKAFTTTTSDVEGWGSVNFDGLYLMTEEDSRSKMKDLYLAELHNDSVNTKNFTIIKARSLDSLKERIDEATGEEKIKLENQLGKLEVNQTDLLPFIEEAEDIKLYSEVVVPQEWLDEYEDKSKARLISDDLDLTPQERRELENRVVAYTVRFDGHNETKTWDKVEPKLKTLLESKRVTYYGTKEDEVKLKFAASVLKKQTVTAGSTLVQTDKARGAYQWSIPETSYGDALLYFDECPTRFKGYWKFSDTLATTAPQILRVSQKNVKTIQKNSNCKHIDEFFCTWDSETSTLSMDKHLIKYLTGKAVGLLPDWIDKLRCIDPKYKDLYNTLYTFQSAYTPYNSDSEEARDIINLIDRMREFQQFVETENDADLIAQKSQELFILADVKATQTLDPEAVKMIAAKEELMEGVHVFLQELRIGYAPSQEFVTELTHYLKSRGKLDVDIPLPQSK